MRKKIVHDAGLTLQIREDYKFRIKEGFDWSRLYDSKNGDDIRYLSKRYPKLAEKWFKAAWDNMPRVTIGNETIIDCMGHSIRTIDGMVRVDDLGAMLGLSESEVLDTLAKIKSNQIGE